ncbi:MAG: radical SAM protein [Candidatus Omnitrophica bacterium]|nr:radical SAM protein [Candidatus Omnitrophota bacterium]
MDKYRIDSHKLMYHIDRVYEWLGGKVIYPIYLEVAPSGLCNHRCIYCGLDFMEYKPIFLKTEIFKKRLKELANLGIKSIMYAGEGEPLLNKDIIELIRYTKNCNIDVALTTNGVLLDKNFLRNTLGYLSWIKVSLDAAKQSTYIKIHRAKTTDFKKVLRNLETAVKIKQKNFYNCTIGVQLVLLPENANEIISLAKIAKNIGVDYFVIKPYSQHPLSLTKKYKNIKYSKYLNLVQKLERLNTDKFDVIFRLQSMRKWDSAKKDYKHCFALSFWSYIDASCNVWACSVYLTKKRFYLGNLYQQSVSEVFESQKRYKLLLWAETKLNTDVCRINCRMDEINRYLWELKHPPLHVNFI